MKSKSKKIIGIGLLGLGAILLSSCTATFCSASDYANMAYPYEQGVTIYCDEATYIQHQADSGYDGMTTDDKAVFDSLNGLALDGNTKIYKIVPYTLSTAGVPSFKAKKAGVVNSVIKSANSSSYVLPSVQFFAAIDDYTLKAAVTQAAIVSGETSDSSLKKFSEIADYSKVNASFISALEIGNEEGDYRWCVNPYLDVDTKGGEDAGIHQINIDSKGNYVGTNSVLRCFGELKFLSITSSKYKTRSNYYKWLKLLRVSDKPGLGLGGCANNDFFSAYRSKMLSYLNGKKSCIATKTDTFGQYGSKRDWNVSMTAKNWEYARRRGLLEAILVYPIASLIDVFAYGVGNLNNGVGQIVAIILVTLIVRIALLLITLPSTLSQQKMQALQPQVAKIQAKYPNANTNRAEKARMAQETQALYKRNHVSMFAPFLVMFFQFPVFVCVWDAMNGSAILSTGSFAGLRLSDSIKDTIFNFNGAWYANAHGWWTALVLFLLMAGSQFVSIFIPQLLQKKRQKKVDQMYKNPNQKSQGNQMKLITYGMLIFTIIMGFFLPSAMGVYWFIGAIISFSQSMITQAISARNAKKKGKK